jgi:hypothetical protein
MSNRFDEMSSPTGSKAKWVKPTVRQLKAGAAEFGTGTNDDGDPGTANNNS